MKALLIDICIMKWPPLENDYTFMSNIGKGSQATVDLYKSKTTRLSFKQASNLDSDLYKLGGPKDPNKLIVAEGHPEKLSG